jgi:hypothetical protein
MTRSAARARAVSRNIASGETMPERDRPAGVPLSGLIENVQPCLKAEVDITVSYLSDTLRPKMAIGRRSALFSSCLGSSMVRYHLVSGAILVLLVSALRIRYTNGGVRNSFIYKAALRPPLLILERRGSAPSYTVALCDPTLCRRVYFDNHTASGFGESAVAQGKLKRPSYPLPISHSHERCCLRKSLGKVFGQLQVEGSVGDP